MCPCVMDVLCSKTYLLGFCYVVFVIEWDDFILLSHFIWFILVVLCLMVSIIASSVTVSCTLYPD